MTTATPLSEIDWSSREVKKDPWPLLRRLRHESPVHWVDSMNFWLVTRYDDIAELFVHPHAVGDRRVWSGYRRPPEGSIFRWIDDYGLMALDKKRHAQQRRLLGSGFTPRGVERMERQIKEVVSRFAEPLKGRSGVVDIMDEFTTPIPNAVISAITGVAATGVDDRTFSHIAQSVIRGFFGFVSKEVLAESEASYVHLSEWVKSAVEARRESPQEDLISDLVHAKDGDYRLGDDDIVAQVSALLAAGSETTAVGGVYSIITLLDHPEALERVRADRSLIPQTVSEILRYAFGGLGGIQRYADADFEFKGQMIEKGQMMVLSGGGASHDPDHYEDPETFDIDRDPKDLLTFGIGPHFCLGANLARGELAAMIDAALDFLPPGAQVLRDRMETQSLGFYDRLLTCPIDFGDGA